MADTVIRSPALAGALTLVLMMADWLLTISVADTFWLKQAVSWQAAEHPVDRTIAVTLPYVPGASSITNGDVSISYGEVGANELAELAANARLALKRLSWMRPMRTIHASPFSNAALRPDPWVRVTR